MPKPDHATSVAVVGPSEAAPLTLDPGDDDRPTHHPERSHRTDAAVAGWAVGAVLTILLAAGASVFIGPASIPIGDVLSGDLTEQQRLYLTDVRVPRTVACLLSGAALAMAGMLMQLLTRNRFVEPSTAGTVESASIGLVLMAMIAPGSPIVMKMLVATAFALAGTALFVSAIRAVPARDSVIVPLIGIMLGTVVGAIATFLALSNDLLQMLNTWMIADLSAVLAGRYELLWIVAGAGVVAYLAADRFTVAGLGEDAATGLGVDHRSAMALGMTIVAIVSAIVVVTVGALPLLGLVVPNIVSTLVGDNARRGLPMVAALGGATVVICDILGRSLPTLLGGGLGSGEIPVGVIVGIVGGAAFLVILLRKAVREG